jgi:hypothetical protein
VDPATPPERGRLVIPTGHNHHRQRPPSRANDHHYQDHERSGLTPGRIVLGHANHPTILGLFDQISDLLRERDLQPATLDEFFGTNRH